MSNFNKGDTVKLKSGGPVMTITTIDDIHGTPTVWTVWFDGTKKMEGDFPPEALKIYEKPVRTGMRVSLI